MEENLGNRVVGRFNIDDVQSITLDDDLIITAEGVTMRFPVEYPL